MVRLGRRAGLAEIMDQPGLDQGQVSQALDGLRRINALSGSVAALWREVRAVVPADSRGTLTLLDVATGAGDIPIGLLCRARNAGIPLAVEACDKNPAVVALATERATRAGCAVRVFVQDVCGDFPLRRYDVVTCSLFLHHLTDGEALLLLRRLAAATGRLLLVSDLNRSLRGWWLARTATRLLTRSPIVHTDAPRSVENAFSMGEIKALAAQAGLQGARLRPQWPQRWLLAWRPA